MRPLLFLCLAAGLSAAAPQVRILSADLVIGPGREPRPGDAPFRPRLELEVAVEGLREGTVPEFRLWRGPAGDPSRPLPPGTRGLARIRAESVAPEGDGRYRLLASPDPAEGTAGRIIVELQVRGRRTARAVAPIRVRALPAPPRPRDDPRS